VKRRLVINLIQLPYFFSLFLSSMNSVSDNFLLRGFLPSWMQLHILHWKFNDVSEEHILKFLLLKAKPGKKQV
jgi:hypothetical protein